MPLHLQDLQLKKAFKIINKWWTIPEVKVIGQFYDHPDFIQCIVNRTKEFKLADFDHILFSYHGIPERHVDKVYLDGKPCADHHCEDEINSDNTNCYKATCYATTRLLVKELNIKEGTYSTCFQSRLEETPG